MKHASFWSTAVRIHLTAALPVFMPTPFATYVAACCSDDSTVASQLDQEVACAYRIDVACLLATPLCLVAIWQTLKIGALMSAQSPYHYVRIETQPDHDVLVVGGGDHPTG